jgi:hypothetical protein
LRALVCGGRQFADAAFIFSTLDALHAERPIGLLIEGAAKGTDRIAGQWAEDRGVEHAVYPADWQGLGRRAGPIRNEQMLREGRPDIVVAFPGGRGTQHMCDLAGAAGIEVYPVEYDKVLPLETLPVDDSALSEAVAELESLALALPAEKRAEAFDLLAVFADDPETLCVGKRQVIVTGRTAQLTEVLKPSQRLLNVLSTFRALDRDRNVEQVLRG